MAKYKITGLPKAQKGKQKRNSYLPGAWARTAPDLIEPGQEAFPLTQTPTIDPLISQERINTQTSANELRDYIIDYYSQNQSINEELNKKKYAERENYYKNLGANEKVTPIETIPIYDYNKIIKQNPSLEKNLKTQGVYINVNKERGFVEMFPANEVYQTILDGSIKNGKSVGETLKDLEKRGYGKVTDIKKQIGTEKLNQIETSVKQHYAYNPAYKPPYLKSNIMASSDYGKIDTSTDLQDKWSDNDIITLARDQAFIDAYDINNFDVTSPNARNDEKWNAQVINKLRSGKWGWKPKTNELIKLEADNAYEPLSIERKSTAENIIDKANAPAGSILSTEFLSQFWDEQDALRKRAQDYTKLGADKFQEKYSPTQEQLQSKWKQGKEAVDIADDASWRPQEMTQKGQRYKYSFEQPYGVDPTTGELITTQVSPDDYAGQTVYLSPEERDKYNKGMTAANMQSVQSHPLYYLPGAIATGTAFAPTSWGGLGLGSSMLNTPIASIPGLTAGNALNAYFGYETLKDEGLAEQAYDAFQKGDIAEGLKNTLYSGLSLAPFAKGAKTLYDVTKGLTGPGMYAGKIATNLPLSASWTNPALTKGLAIQNPGWSSATKELLPGFTSRFNKALGPQLGQIKLYGAGTNPAASSQGLLGNSGALGLSGNAAPIYYNLDDYMGPNVSVPIKYPADSYSPFKPEGQPWQGGNWTYEYDPNKPKEFKGAGLDFNYYKSTLPPFSSKAFSDIGDFNFKPFSEGWLANQRMSNLATYGKQPLLKRSDFATNEEMMIDKLMAKHKGNFDAMLKEAEEEQISPDAVLKRQLDLITYKADPKLRSERPAGSAPFYLPENWSTSNRATIWNNNFGNYRPFGKELNEFGTMGGKAAISFGTSGEFDQYYWDQIKRHEEFLTGDYDLSPEQREKIQSKLNSLYQKGVKQGTQLYGGLGFDLENPMRYTGYDAMRTLSPNQYGGLHKAQFGKIIQGLEGMMQVAPRFTKLPSANILNAIPEETHALNKMLGFAAGPQYQLSSKDFFTDDELIKMAQQQVDYQNARDQFDIDNPQNPGMAVWNSLLGDTSREELFSLLYPNASMPNFKSKFIFPQAEKQLQTYLRDYNVPSLRNKGDISKGMLGNLTKDLNKEVPYQLKYLNDMQDEKGWLYTADPKIVVTEHRGSLGLTSDDIKNASPEQFEKWRQQLVKTIKANSLIAYKSLLGNPFTAKDAYSKMKLNKYGGSK